MMIRLAALGSVIYLVVAIGGSWVTNYMQRQLEIIACQQAAHADRRDDGECRELALKPIALVGR
jgi:hypothetical protein